MLHPVRRNRAPAEKILPRFPRDDTAISHLMLKRSFSVLGGTVDNPVPRLVMQETRVLKARTTADDAVPWHSSTLARFMVPSNPAIAQAGLEMRSHLETPRHTASASRRDLSAQSNSDRKEEETEEAVRGSSHTRPYIVVPLHDASTSVASQTTMPSSVHSSRHAGNEIPDRRSVNGDLPDWLKRDLSIRRNLQRLCALLDAANRRENQWGKLVELRDSQIQDLKTQIAVDHSSPNVS